MILGDPGSGKSTLLRYLALTYARAVYFGRNEAGSDLGPVRFPILIRIAYYAEHGMPKGQSLSDFLGDYYRMRECPRTGLADLLATELAGGNCIILLDGLDEIVSADDRRKVVERVEDFIRSDDNRPNRFVITSRRAGYRDASLSEPFVHYVVEDMNDTQIQRFLEHWCVVLEPAELSQKVRQVAAQHEINAIMRAVRDYPGVHRLATNPLLLCLLVQLHRTIAHLPRRRIELYQAAAETLARTWRIARLIPESELEYDRYLPRLLGRLAYWLHANKPTGLATEREVYEVLGEEWAHIKGLAWDEDNPDIAIEVKKFLRTVREHTGIFVERAPKWYGFMHLTFEEYYTAWYLIRRSKDRASLIRKHLHQSRWEEPILLGLGLVSPDDAEDLIETTILAQGEEAKELGFAPSAYEEFLGCDYLFVLRCLGENISVRPEIKKWLLKRMVDELLYQTGSGRFHLYYEELEDMLKYLGESEVASVLSSLFIEALPSANAQVRGKIMESFSRLGHTSLQVINVLITALDDADKEVRRLSGWSLMRLKLTHPSPELITTLTEALRNNHKSARVAAAQLLGQYEQYSLDVVTALIAALHDPNAQVRYTVAQSLGKLDRTTSQVVAALLKTLRDIDPTVRGTAIKSLERLGEPPLQVVTALIEALHDTDSEIHAGIVRSLGGLGYRLPPVEEAVVAALHDTEAGVRAAVAESLGQLDMASPQVETALIKALHDIDPRVKNSAAYSLNKPNQMSSQIIIALIEALHDVDVRATAATSLRNLEQTSPEGMAALIEALHDGDFYVRRAVMHSLGHLGRKSSQAATTLIEALYKAAAIASQQVENLEQLDQTFFQDVIALLWSLLDIGRDTFYLVIENMKQSDQTAREAATLLIKALPFADSDIIGTLIGSLDRLGKAFPNLSKTLGQLDRRRGVSDEVVKALLTSLDSPILEIRSTSTENLGNIGQKKTADEITTALFNSLDDNDFKVRYAAAKRLRELGQISPKVLDVQLEALNNKSLKWEHDSIARFLAQHGRNHEAIIQSLWEKLRDEKYPGRLYCAQALALLGRRFPNNAETIGKKLVQAIEDPELSKTDTSGWSGHSLAYEALRLLVADGEPNKR